MCLFIFSSLFINWKNNYSYYLMFKWTPFLKGTFDFFLTLHKQKSLSRGVLLNSSC